MLSELTSGRSVGMVRYQVYSVLRAEGRPEWTKQEDQILERILAIDKKYETVGMWCQVSRELFLRGDMNRYKSGKCCR